ncbi:hypothetical protein F0562_028973 [Nyssa sinensis]|uniref:Carboxypeptidase n=1 Tax=Nyssa sinensis TaxID=561372 RepID=A0A5J5AZN0_9ASTE|nr:hypothetical protein F0562_028973 [Nyssa sinensis]
MGHWRSCGIVFQGLCLLLVFGGGVGGFPVEDLVVRLPGQPKVGFRQYAGYVDVDHKAGRSLFYYFVEAEQNATSLPLTLWLNGGPGCSSIGGGAFTELGPFFPSGNGRGLRINSKSWNKARDTLTFMLKWYEKFPDFKSRDLFLTGESYAGHYIPQLANVLLDYNKRSKNFKFNIKGVAIGNPLLRLDRDTPATYEFFWSHGMISDESGLTIMNECNFEDYIFPSPHNETQSCNQALIEANNIVGDYINFYDVILDVCYPSIVEQELRLRKMVTKMSVGVDVCMTIERYFYFNLPEVQKALHANRTNLPYEWSTCSNVLNYSEEDGDRDMLPLLKRIIQNHIPVWVFSGDQDSVVPLMGSRTLVRELADDLNFKITVPYGAWFHKGQVGGWHIEYGNLLTFATIRGAAHMVPYAQPSRALHLFSSFLHVRIIKPYRLDFLILFYLSLFQIPFLLLLILTSHIDINIQSPLAPHNSSILPLRQSTRLHRKPGYLQDYHCQLAFSYTPSSNSMGDGPPQSGPGCSSIGGGAFTELGPFFPSGNGRASNLLFLESPAGVGWSYSNTTADYTCGDDSTARDTLTFMLKWYEKFPDFKSRDLFLTGESYAELHVLIFIGNPLLRLDRDTPETYEFFWSHGMISDEIGLTIMNECNFEDYIFPSPHNVTQSCNQALIEANNIVGDYINFYDVILDVCYPSIVEQELRLRKMVTKMSVGVDVCMTIERYFYFNLPEVQKALHANRTNLPVLNYNEEDGDRDMLPLLKRIIQNHIPVWVFSHIIGISQAQLRVGSYAETCPDAESIVAAVVRDASLSNSKIAPVLLRLHFHDCFVQGCDGSILIANGPNAERHAFGHQGVGGFEVIEKAKAQLEAVCPGVVSCADIVALAARDAIASRNGPAYQVPTGRRDGLVSDVSFANNMPDVSDSIQQLKAKFFQKGLSEKDLVLLSAAHTIGTTACFFMTQRLYNFQSDGGSDPSINPSFLPELKSQCPQNGDVNVRLPIDRGSEQTFDEPNFTQH